MRLGYSGDVTGYLPMPAPPTPPQQLLVSAMIETSRTQVVAAMCLHCKRLPASKVEGPDGFTLCSDCYFATGVDGSNFMQLPPRTAQDRMIAVLVARVHDLTTELAAARNALIGGS